MQSQTSKYDPRRLFTPLMSIILLLLWSTVWVYVLIHRLNDIAVIALQIIGVITVISCIALYALTNETNRRHLSWIPVMLVSLPLIGAVAARLIGQEIGGEIGQFTRNVFGFLIFPAGAVAGGFAIAMMVDLTLKRLHKGRHTLSGGA
jgi:hypothetical protein